MTSLLNFRPLSSSPHIYASLLQIDTLRILLDCAYATPQELQTLQLIAPTIHLCLLTHPTTQHTNAIHKIQLQCPIYATTPTKILAKLANEWKVETERKEGKINEGEYKEIRTAFEGIISVKFEQMIEFVGENVRLGIHASAAGHSLGGAIWKIKKDTDDIVYAVNWNHKKERHLNPTTLINISRPSLLITDARNASSVQPTRSKRDRELIETIIQTIHGQGTVLIPSDATSRMLELALFLDSYWTEERIGTPLIWLSINGEKVKSAVKGMLEWCGDAVTNEFDATRENPWEFQKLVIMRTLSQLPPGPKVVLASGDTLESGLAQQLFIELAKSELNTVIISLNSEGLSSRLTESILAQEPLKQVDITTMTAIPLEGYDLVQYEQEQAERRRKERSLTPVSSDSEDSENEHEPLQKEAVGLFEFSNDVYVWDDWQEESSGFHRNRRSKMFPFHERKWKEDEYGEILLPGEFKIEGQEEDSDKKRNEALIREMNQSHTIDELEAEDQVPSKCKVEHKVLHLRCQMKYLDFEGLADGKSIRTVISNIMPRKLILINGPQQVAEDLRANLSESKIETILIPQIDEMVNVSTATNIWQIKLTDNLQKTLYPCKMADYQLSILSGIIRVEDEEAVPTLVLPSCTSVDHFSQAVWNPDPKTLMIGDIKLTEMKRLLLIEGIAAEFDKQGGLLVGDGQVYISKTQKEELKIEGNVCTEWITARNILYTKLLAVI